MDHECDWCENEATFVDLDGTDDGARYACADHRRDLERSVIAREVGSGNPFGGENIDCTVVSVTRTRHRACYYLAPDRQSEIVLTGPEHSDLDDDALIAEAVEEARRGDVVGSEPPRITEDELRDGLRIGDYEQ